VLDAGAGTGFLSLLLARQGYRVTAVDLSAAMLQILTSNAAARGPGIDTANADAASPPRPDLRRRRRTPPAVDPARPGHSADGLAGGGPRRRLSPAAGWR